jgi:hypothetical protein
MQKAFIQICDMIGEAYVNKAIGQCAVNKWFKHVLEDDPQNGWLSSPLLFMFKRFAKMNVHWHLMNFVESSLWHVPYQSPGSFCVCICSLAHLLFSLTGFYLLHGLSPWATTACRWSDCQLLRIEGHVVSMMDPYGRILDFLDRSRYFSIE